MCAGGTHHSSFVFIELGHEVLVERSPCNELDGIEHLCFAALALSIPWTARTRVPFRGLTQQVRGVSFSRESRAVVGGRHVICENMRGS